MTSISELLDNIKTLVNQYFYTKEETQENFNNYLKNNITYNNGYLNTETYTHVLSTTGPYQSLEDIIADDLNEYRIFIESGTYTYSTNTTFTVPVTMIGDSTNPPTINCKEGASWCTLDYRNLTNIESTIKNINWQGTRTITEYGLNVKLGGNKITVDNCSFDGIWSRWNGKTLVLDNCEEGSNIIVTRCNFTNNKTTEWGHLFGSILIGGTLVSNVNINHCLFNNLKPRVTNAKEGANGGGILITNADYDTTTPEIGNAIAYCNTYTNPSIDYNYRITESECNE